jgi:AcrR family transcriptional regulator
MPVNSAPALDPRPSKLRGEGVSRVDAQAVAAGPDSDSAKRRQILEGARAAFLAQGFDGASMNDVARVAGVSKGTLYVYFPSKDALFAALVRETKARQAERLAELSNDLEPAETLRRYGVSLMEVLSTPESIAQVRTILGVAAKFPQVGRAFYEAGPAHGVAKLAVYLAAETASGRLRACEPEIAATQFLDLCKSGLSTKLLFGVVDRLSRDEIEAGVARAVDAFMTLYGAPRG